MSYILDALRKSEQERQRGKVPDLNSFKEDTPEPARSTNLWPWVTVAVVVVNLAIVTVMWAPWREPSPQPVEPVAFQPQPAHPQPAPVAAGASPQATAPVAAPAPAPAPIVHAPPVQQMMEPAPSTIVVDNRPPIQAQPTFVSPATPDLAAEPVDVYSAAAPTVAYMPQLEELSAADRAGVPDMTFSSHMYSSVPRFRSIIINGKRLKEGEYFTPTLQVREITDKGVIMSNGNVLFSVDVLGRWAQ